MQHENFSSAKSNISFATLFDALPGNSILLQKDAPHFTIVAATPQYLKESCAKKETLIGKGVFEAFPSNPADPADTGERNLLDSLTYVLQHQVPHTLPAQRYDVLNENGVYTERHWRASNTPVFDNDGKVAFIIHTITEITNEVKAAQMEERMKGMELVNSLYMQAPTPIQIYKGSDLVITLANPPTLAIWGKGPEIVGRPLKEILPEVQAQGFTELLLQVMETGEAVYLYDTPATFLIKGKEETGYYNTVYQPYYERGKAKAAGVLVFGFDVTQKVLAEQKAAESEDRFRVLADQAPMMVFMANTEAEVTYWNRYWLEYTGQNHEQALGRGWSEVVHPDDYESLLKGYIYATSERHSYSIEARMKRWDGQYRYFLFTGGPRYSRIGTFLGNIGTGVDIHDRKQAERASEESEKNLRSMILQSPVAMSILRGPSFVVEIANERMFELWGRSEKELLNKSIFEGLPEARDQGYEQLLTGVFATGKTFSAYGIPVTLPRKSGIETVYINVLYEAFREGDGTISGIMVVATDVTDQVVASMKVQESITELQFALDVMPQMVWVTLANGYHDFYNKQWYDYTGLTYNASKDTGWNTVLHPDDESKAGEIWRHSLETGEPYEIEYRFKRFDGVYRWFLGRALPLKDEAGRILKWFGTCTDIDDQKKGAQLMEEMVKERTQQLEATVRELERSNANLEEFAYAASHDLKEPIRKIRTFSERIKSQFKERFVSDDDHYFVRMERATERMQSLIDDLLEYSHVSTLKQFEPDISLNKKVAQVLEDLELEIAEKKANVTVGSLPVIKGNRRQLQQLFQNLITNALKFSRPEVAPEITISSSVVKGEDIAGITPPEEMKNRLYNLVEISDNGIGFEQQYSETIFRMFQRLHGRSDYEGTGIGLAIVRKVVENHKGFIRAVSKLGEGATFKIFLPNE